MYYDREQQLDILARKDAILTGMIDEAIAKIKLYRIINNDENTTEVKRNDLSRKIKIVLKDLDRYEKIRKKHIKEFKKLDDKF